VRAVLLAHDVGLLPDALRDRGVTAIHVDPRDVPWRVGFSQRDRGADHAAWFEVDGARVALDDAAVWIADADVAAHLPDGLPPEVHIAAVGESRRALLGVLDALPGPVLDPPWATHAAANPLAQAAAIRAAGLRPARWFVGYDPDALAAFTAAAPHGVEGGPHLASPRRAHPGPGERREVVLIGQRALGAPPALAASLVAAARALHLRQAHAELHLAPDGAITVLSLRPAVPDPREPAVADALADALTRIR
jgi:hypothetical protein